MMHDAGLCRHHASSGNRSISMRPINELNQRAQSPFELEMPVILVEIRIDKFTAVQ